MAENKKKPQGTIVKNLMAGLGVFVPVAATLALVIAIIQKFDAAVIGVLDSETGKIVGGLPDAINPGYYVPFLYDFPGVGLIAVGSTLFFGGAIVRTWLGAKIANLSHYIMEQIPFVGTVFKMIKKIIDQVTKSDENSVEKKPVNIEYTRDDVYVPAFSLGLSKMFKCPKTGDRLEVVYVPTSPNPTSGFVLFIHPKLVHDVEYTTNEQMEFVLSCGFSEKEIPSVMAKQGIDAQITSTGEIVTRDGVVEVLDDNGDATPDPVAPAKK